MASLRSPTRSSTTSLSPATGALRAPLAHRFLPSTTLYPWATFCCGNAANLQPTKLANRLCLRTTLACSSRSLSRRLPLCSRVRRRLLQPVQLLVASHSALRAHLVCTLAVQLLSLFRAMLIPLLPWLLRICTITHAQPHAQLFLWMTCRELPTRLYLLGSRAGRLFSAGCLPHLRPCLSYSRLRACPRLRLRHARLRHRGFPPGFRGRGIIFADQQLLLRLLPLLLYHHGHGHDL